MFGYIATKTDYLSMTMGTRFAYVFVPFDNRLPSVSSTLQHFSNNKTKNIKKKIIQIFQALRSGSALILKSTFHTHFRIYIQRLLEDFFFFFKYINDVYFGLQMVFYIIMCFAQQKKYYQICSISAVGNFKVIIQKEKKTVFFLFCLL